MIERVLGKQSCGKLKAQSLLNDTIQRRVIEMANDVSFQLILKLKSCVK